MNEYDNPWTNWKTQSWHIRGNSADTVWIDEWADNLRQPYTDTINNDLKRRALDDLFTPTA